ncbi:MAG: ribose 5-phosphate isomerase B [Candidatus Omnitrophica bacterium]|nr:ribose 5-phosphate isomerase B [Candidatus Omnitrophota bacterium]
MVAIGADHGGYELKEAVKVYLESKMYKVKDYGTDSKESVDYPDFGLKVAKAVAEGEAETGILICTTGIGQSITANKVPGIRAALCLNEDQAKFSRLHNNANVIVFGARYTDEDKVKEMIDVYLTTGFDGGRHQRRLDKIAEIEKRYKK